MARRPYRNAEQWQVLIAQFDDSDLNADLDSIKVLLEKHFSPEQISGLFRVSRMKTISHERIYQHVWQDKKQEGALYQFLRRSGRKYLKCCGGKTSHGRIVGLVGIEERPQVMDQKSRVGG